MRSWAFFLVILFSINKAVIAQSTTEKDSVCAEFSKYLPKFPEINSIEPGNIFVNQYLTPEESDTTLYVVVTNRELVRNRHGLAFSNNLNDELSYLTVSRKQNSYTIKLHKSLQEALKSRHNLDENMIYVHGYGRTFSTILEESEKIRRYYNVPLIVFDWPSKYPEVFELKSYLYSRNNLKQSCSYFASFLLEYQNYVKSLDENKTMHSSLIMHSMGNALLEQAIKQELLCEIENELFEKVILNAAAIKKSGHKKWLKNTHITEEIYVISNYNDPTLYGLFWLTLRKQLGRAEIKKQSNGITYINLGHIAAGHHDYFLNKDLMQKHPELKVLYFKLLTTKNCNFPEFCQDKRWSQIQD